MDGDPHQDEDGDKSNCKDEERAAPRYAASRVVSRVGRLEVDDDWRCQGATARRTGRGIFADQVTTVGTGLKVWVPGVPPINLPLRGGRRFKPQG